MIPRHSVENIVHTYIQIARQVPGTVIVRESDHVRAIGPMAHPLCSCIMYLGDDPAGFEVPEECREPHFLFYEFGQRGAPPGFVRSYSLACLTSGEASGEPASLTRAAAEEERLEVAQFAAHQFFKTSPRDFVDTLVKACSSEEAGFELYGVRLGRKLAAACMFVETSGALGLYNLCVDRPHRGKGLGSSLAAAFTLEAQRRGKAGVLQCDPRLTEWYESLGFSVEGELRAWKVEPANYIFESGSKFWEI